MAGPLVGIVGILLLAGAMALFLGLTLLALGLRGRRVNDHPLCRACGFDLVGVYDPAPPPEKVDAPQTGDGAAPRCPECGSDLSAPRSVRRGQRVRRRWMLWTGAALLLVVVGAGGGAAWGTAKGFNWNTVKPFWMLMYEAEGSDQASAPGALKELVARVSNDRLNSGQIRRLIDGALTAQADSSVPFVDAWGDVIGAAAKAGHTTPADLERFVRQGLSVTLRVRQRVPTGKKILFIAAFDTARLGNSGLDLITELDRATLGGVVLDPRPYYGGPNRIHADNHGKRYSYIRGVVAAGVGRAELDTHWRVRMVGPGTDEAHPIAEWVQGARAVTEIVPESEPVIVLRTDDQTRSDVKSALRLTHVNATISPGMGNVLYGGLAADKLPVDIVAQVVLRRDGREWPLGTVEVIRDDHGGASATFLLRLPDDVPRGPIDVVLVPGLGVETNSVVDTILGSEIVFEQFPIDWTILDRQAQPPGQK